MASLSELRSRGEKRALLIAATGTGKTYLSIFDVKQCAPGRVLYVAHRDMILNKSEKSFKHLLPNIKTGFLNGNKKDVDAQYLFASVFTLAKDEVLHSFSKNHFDYIVVDEVHHAGAESYKKIIDYFAPKFLLGLTATPERGDGFDIFSMFNHNIPYEIRLQKALEEDLLCPFHYYGITDNGVSIARFFYRVNRILFYWLNRRSQKRSYTWEQYKSLLKDLPLARPKIYVSIYA